MTWWQYGLYIWKTLIDPTWALHAYDAKGCQVVKCTYCGRTIGHNAWHRWFGNDHHFHRICAIRIGLD